MVKRFVKHLNKYSIIPVTQSGFRMGRSTNSALVRMISDISKAMDTFEVALLILLDYRKVFDTISQAMLPSKLRDCSCESVGLSWFNSYLSDRKQAVSLHGTLSSYIMIGQGVPQGSVPPCLLFTWRT